MSEIYVYFVRIARLNELRPFYNSFKLIIFTYKLIGYLYLLFLNFPSLYLNIFIFYSNLFFFSILSGLSKLG